MEPEYIYIAMYNPMIHESSFGIISAHTTQKGAEMAMEFHREECRKEWLELYPDVKDQSEYPFGKFESWMVMTFKLLT